MDTTGRRGVQAVIIAASLFAFLFAGLLWSGLSSRPQTEPPRPAVGSHEGWEDVGPGAEERYKDPNRLKRPVFSDR